MSVRFENNNVFNVVIVIFSEIKFGGLDKWSVILFVQRKGGVLGDANRVCSSVIPTMS